MDININKKNLVELYIKKNHPNNDNIDIYHSKCNKHIINQGYKSGLPLTELQAIIDYVYPEKEIKILVPVVEKKHQSEDNLVTKFTGVRFLTRNAWFARKYAIDADCIKPLVAKYANELIQVTAEVDANPGKKKKTDQERRKAIGTRFYNKIDDAGEFKEGTQLFMIFSSEKNEYTRKKETEVKSLNVANIPPSFVISTNSTQPPILPLGPMAPISIGGIGASVSHRPIFEKINVQLPESDCERINNCLQNMLGFAISIDHNRMIQEIKQNMSICNETNIDLIKYINISKYYRFTDALEHKKDNNEILYIQQIDTYFLVNDSSFCCDLLNKYPDIIIDHVILHNEIRGFILNFDGSSTDLIVKLREFLKIRGLPDTNIKVISTTIITDVSGTLYELRDLFKQFTYYLSIDPIKTYSIKELIPNAAGVIKLKKVIVLKESILAGSEKPSEETKKDNVKHGVYIISTSEKAKNNIFKIGKHTGSQGRLLSRYKTSLIDPYICYFHESDDYSEIEKLLLGKMEDFRIKNEDGRKTEWIKLELSKIIQALIECVA